MISSKVGTDMCLLDGVVGLNFFVGITRYLPHQLRPSKNSIVFESDLSVTIAFFQSEAHFRIKLSDINTGEGEVYFNAFRLETDGGVINKYLYALNPTFVPKFHITEKFLWLKDYAD